jgi:hypothetical protein
MISLLPMEAEVLQVLALRIDLDGSSEYAYDIEICNNYIHDLEGLRYG